jgi:hypothetical protein
LTEIIKLATADPAALLPSFGRLVDNGADKEVIA